MFIFILLLGCQEKTTSDKHIYELQPKQSEIEDSGRPTHDSGETFVEEPTAQPCSHDMVLVNNHFCIDQFEAAAKHL